MTSHNIRILRTSTTTLNALVDQGRLRATTERLSGINGTVYTASDGNGLEPRVLDHFSLSLAGVRVAANLFALPPEEYSGLLAASPDFTQVALAHLLPPLQAPMTPAMREGWFRDLRAALHAGPRADQTLHLVEQPVYPALWRAKETRLSRSSCGWLLTLIFDTPRVDPIAGLTRSAAGIDVGLSSLAVAAFISGLTHRVPGVPDLQSEEREAGDSRLQSSGPYSGDVKRHAMMLQHAAARDGLQALIRVLLGAATVVYLEDLSYKDMSDQFKDRSRVLGLRDFLMGWLPQRLATQGIDVLRVPPDLTSQYCAVTHLRGRREGRIFTGPFGQEVDADLNAARNLAQIGLAYRLNALLRTERR